AIRKALASVIERACLDPEAAKTAIESRRKELARDPDMQVRLPFTIERVKPTFANAACDADTVAPTRVMSGDEIAKLAAKEESRAQRAQTVIAQAAGARATLLRAESFADIAARTQADVERVRVEKTAEIVEEPMATGEDLAALRESP